MRYIAFISGCLLVLGSCTRPAETDHQQEEPAIPGTVTMTSAQASRAGIRFGAIGKQVLSHDIRAKGKLILPPGGNVLIGPLTGGTVQAILVAEGQQVKRNATLAVLTSPEIIALQQQYLVAASRYVYQKSEFHRQELLNREKINADKQLEEARNLLDEAEAIYRGLRMQMDLLHLSPEALDKGEIRSGMPIVTPVEGFVERILVQLGEFVEPNTVMFRVINKGNLFLELRVFEKDVPYIRLGQRVTFSLANLGDAVFKASIVTVGKTLDENARTVRVLAAFSDPSPSILPGMFVSAEIHTDEQEVDALPEEAVVPETDSTGYVFYTQTTSADSVYSFLKLPVSTGFTEDGYIQVTPLTPIPSGAQLVISGSYFIKAEEARQTE